VVTINKHLPTATAARKPSYRTFQLLSHLSTVMAGLDPATQPAPKNAEISLGPRVKPGDDGRESGAADIDDASPQD
jgi:hypothetical protein